MTTPTVGPTAASLDMRVYQGVRWRRTLTFVNRDDEGNETPIDLTGAVFVAHIRFRRTDSDPTAALLAETAEDDDTLAANQLRLTLTAEQAAALTARSYVWDLDWTDAGGDVTTPIAGRVLVTGQVTR